MTFSEYQRLAMRTSNQSLARNEHLANGALGLAGEAGEACDLIKKFLFQGHELNRERVIKELGDVLWYVAETANALDVSLDDVAWGNILKLEARYPEGFDADKSVHRKDGDV